jgi:hypothetical protein
MPENKGLGKQGGSNQPNREGQFDKDKERKASDRIDYGNRPDTERGDLGDQGHQNMPKSGQDQGRQ